MPLFSSKPKFRFLRGRFLHLFDSKRVEKSQLVTTPYSRFSNSFRIKNLSKQPHAKSGTWACISITPIFLFLFLLFGCGREVLFVYTDYVSYENLASYHVNTPDPSLNNPPLGQRLIVSWALPKDKPKADAFQLKIIIRFCNREEIVKCFFLRKPVGTYLFSLLNEKYCEKGGILTYKVQLLEKGRLIEERRHQLWAELITFEDEAV